MTRAKRASLATISKLVFMGLIAASTGLASGCGSGGSPTGTNSPASNSAVTTSTSTSTSTSTGTTTTLSAIAWSRAQVMPGSYDTLWVFVTDNGNLNTTTMDVLVNGTAKGLPTSGPTPFGIGQGTGQLLQVSPVPSAGSSVQVTVQDLQNNTVLSNTITVGAAGSFIAGNLPPTFATVTPARGATAQGTNPDLVFAKATTATAYQVVVFQIGTNGQGNPVISDIPCAVVVTPSGSGNQTYQVGSGTPATSFANLALPASGTFFWHAVALDGNGYGVGTTIDVAGFNAAGTGTPSQSVLATWPYFTSN